MPILPEAKWKNWWKFLAFPFVAPLALTYLAVDGVLTKRENRSYLVSARKQYLQDAEAFVRGKSDADFAELLSRGLELSGKNYKELAQKTQVIPSTVRRWERGTAKPLAGMQKLVILKLRTMVDVALLRARIRSLEI